LFVFVFLNVTNWLFPIVDEPEGNTDGQREVNVVMKTPAVKATRKLYQIVVTV